MCAYVQVLLFEPSKNKGDEFVFIPSYVAYHSVEEEAVSETVSGAISPLQHHQTTYMYSIARLAYIGQA